MDLKGAVAVVTGGNGGLGQRICHALAGAGANIAVVYAQSANEAGAVADELCKHQVEAEPFQCDLRQPAQIAVAIQFGVCAPVKRGDRELQWKIRPESIATVCPVIVSVRHIVTT